MADKITISAPDWWIDTMEYLRTVSGTVYSDQLKSFTLDKIKQSRESVTYDGKQSIVDFLNNPSSGILKYGFIKEHPLTGEIYTIPYMRQYLDKYIKDKNKDYIYNEYLYKESFNEPNIIVRECNTVLWDTIIDFNDNEKEITINFNRVKEKDAPLFCINSFDLGELYRYATAKKGNYQIKSIVATDLVFSGDCKIGFDSKLREFPSISETCDFSGSTFIGNVEIFNLVFAQEESKTPHVTNLINFRNTRCFESIKIRNVRFCGATDDSRISFEDSRISKDFEISNSDFGCASLYCFQTVFGDFLMEDGICSETHNIVLNNINFQEGAYIDFVDAEFGKGCISIKNMNLYETVLCFAPEIENDTEICPDITLKIDNCNILNNITISNVSELSFKKSKNFGRIIDDSGWRNVNTTTKPNYRNKTKGLGGTIINNKLLLAVYNYGLSAKKTEENGYYKAKDFVMLKENFVSQGMYDEEDTAFILYMEFKPYIDKAKKTGNHDNCKKKISSYFLYNILYASGKYGISPVRVGVVLAFTTLIFSTLYFIISIFSSGEVFSIGSIILPECNCILALTKNLISLIPNTNTDNLCIKLIGSFLYSLQNIIPFVSQFEPFNLGFLMLTALENFIGSFMVGYFSVAVVRKTLR